MRNEDARRRRSRGPILLGVGALVVVRLLVACGQTVEVGRDDALALGGGSVGGMNATGGTVDGGGSAAEGGGAECAPIKCRGAFYDCGDCLDNDEDGLVDALDPDCLGPCDNDEAGLSTGVLTPSPGACRQDCYFDGDNGQGNDQCEWSHACDPLSVPPDFPPSGEARCEFQPEQPSMGLDCQALAGSQPAACLEACLPLVPNGCDCFGCCEVPGGSGDFRFIGRGSGERGCRLDALDDVEACPPCTPVDSCFNACEDCEVCIGRPLQGGCGMDSRCPPGQAACTTDAPCDFQEYCVTGCCVRAPEPT